MIVKDIAIECQGVKIGDKVVYAEGHEKIRLVTKSAKNVTRCAACQAVYEKEMRKGKKSKKSVEKKIANLRLQKSNLEQILTKVGANLTEEQRTEIKNQMHTIETDLKVIGG